MADTPGSERLDTLHWGTHACLIHRGLGEYMDALARTFERASSSGHRILWIGRELDTRPIQDLLERVGSPGRAENGRIRSTLRVVDSSPAASSDDTLDRDALIHLLREETILALHDGHGGLQVIQEMSGWMRTPRDIDAVKEYEAALSTFLPGSSCSVLCLYDQECCTPEQLLGLLDVHSHVLMDAEPWENIYAVSPEDLLELNVPRTTLTRRLRNLVKHKDAEQTRRRHTSMVELLHDVVWAGHEAESVDEVIRIVLEEICQEIGWPLAHAYRFDDTTQELVPTTIWYMEDEERFKPFRDLTDAIRLPLGVGLSGRAAERREPIWMAEIRDDADRARSRMGKKVDVRSAFAAPIASNGDLHYVFEFFSSVHREADPVLLGILDEVGVQLSQVLVRKQAETDLRLLETAVSHLDEAILILTPDILHPEGPEIVYTNPAITAITGYSQEEARGRRISILFGPKTDNIVRDRSVRDLSEGESVTREVVAYRKDESEFVLQYHISPVRSREGRVTHLVAVFRDLTAERRAEEAIRRADHDSLTGLPNRDLFTRRLERSVERARDRSDERFAVLFLDLDRFKVINDSLGHLRGDQLLVSLARRLERTVRPEDTVARFGGDEFVILVERADAVENVTAVAHRIEEELAAPFTIGSRELYTTASIGIALSDTGYTLPEDVLRDADAAMYRAKAKGGGTYEVFDRTLHDDAVSVLRMETDLHRAVKGDEFELHYQPIVSLDDNRTVGFEALLRWNHPERGLLLPSEFLGLAEETGLIVPIGRWVLNEAGRKLRSWQEHLDDPTLLKLSVNLSAREFGSEKLMSTIRTVLRDHALVPDTLRMEITENALIDRPDRVESILHELLEMGVSVSLDDFGTGYSSLGYLHRFPVKMLKIDRLFIHRLGEKNGRKKRGEEIVRAILALARNLELEVTAEGVENWEQLRRLRSMACPTGQGFYFSRPLTTAQADDLLLPNGGAPDAAAPSPAL